MPRRVRPFAGLVLFALAAAAPADPPAEATVTDADGNEVKVSAVRFGAGARRLAWAPDPDDAKKGVLALEVREPHSTGYAKGVVTYVPLGAVESVRYDYDKRVSAVAVKGLPEPLVGTLQYKGVNALGLDGTADGKAVKYAGGTFAKDHIKGVAFAGAKPLPARKGLSAWQVQIDQPKAMDPTLAAGNVKFLLRHAGGAEVLADAVPAASGPPLALDDAVTRLAVLAVDPNRDVAVVEVRAGAAERVAVVPLEFERDGKKVALVGLVGEVDAGWKLFPLHTIKTMKRVKKD